MHGLRKLLREIHRRSLWQVLGIYLAGSWGVLQVVDYMTGFAGLPGWTPSFAFILLLIGLPIVTATAFVQEGVPGLRGEYRDEQDPNTMEGLTPEQVHRDPGAHPLDGERVLTWRNAILGGVGAATLLVASVVAYFGMWAAGIGPMGNLVAQGVISQGDAVVLATFDDATGEGLGDVVTQALRVDLSQGEVLRMVEPAELADVRQRMQLPEGAPFTADLAMDAAVRQGIKAVLAGEVSSAGTGYLITAVLQEAASGRALASFRASANGPDHVIAAIDQLSQDIREKAGESLRNIRSGEPLEAVTTSSLEALRLYAESDLARERGEAERAIELLREAVGMDPAFAMAWRMLGVVYANVGVDQEGLIEAVTQSFEHRDRLTERERYLAEALYYDIIAQDRPRVIAAYKNVLRVAPDEPAALNNLANEYMNIEELEEAGALYRRAVDGPGRSNTAFENLIRNRVSMGRYAEAADVLEEYEAAYPDDASLWEWRFFVAFMNGDLAGAAERVRPVAADPARPAWVRATAMDYLGLVAYWEGRLDDGRRYFLDAERMAAQVSPGFAWARRVWTAYSEVQVGDAAWGLAHLRQGLDDGTWASLPDLDRAHWFTGVTLALAGDGAGAARVADAMASSQEAAGAGATGRVDRLDLEKLRIAVRATEGDPDAVAALDANLTEFGCVSPRCDLSLRAWVNEMAGDAQTAIARHESIRTRGFLALSLNGPYRLRSTLRLGPLYEEVGDTAAAVEAYQRLVDQWSDADARGRRAVEAAEARIQALRTTPD